LKSSHDDLPTSLSNAHVLTDEATLGVALDCLLEHVELEMQGDCGPQTLFEILLRAASKHDSIEHTINSLAGAPSGKTIPYHLDKMKRWVVFRQENFEGLRPIKI